MGVPFPPTAERFGVWTKPYPSCAAAPGKPFRFEGEQWWVEPPASSCPRFSNRACRSCWPAAVKTSPRRVATIRRRLEHGRAWLDRHGRNRRRYSPQVRPIARVLRRIRASVESILHSRFTMPLVLGRSRPKRSTASSPAGRRKPSLPGVRPSWRPPRKEPSPSIARRRRLDTRVLHRQCPWRRR